MNYRRPKILVVDNYDSFTYNLVQLIREHGMCDFDVVRNNGIYIASAADYDGFIFSPGPGIPAEAPVMRSLLGAFPGKSFLGICLGYQAIAETFGMKLVKLETVRHGLKTTVRLIKPFDNLFDGMPSEFSAGLYHSWGIYPDTDSADPASVLRVTALSDDGIIMAVAHNQYNIRGVQFHPESYLSDQGSRIVQNWLNRILME